MMLAFYVDQIQQNSCRYFRIVLRELKTKAKPWESIRAVFKILPGENVAQALLSVAEMYQIKLE